MKYERTVILKTGEECLLRGAGLEDTEAVIDLFRTTHAETDFLLSYPDEDDMTEESERNFLSCRAASDNAIEILAFLDGKAVGQAGISPIGSKAKIRHRAEFGIAVRKEYWGRGIGRELMKSCIECAKAAGYRQMELEVIAGNRKAENLYRKFGFEEYGRNPRGFLTRDGEWQEQIMMRLEIDYER